MILIFGGTTEGRLAVDVCEEAGKTFYYSTKSSSQSVVMHNGQRICGAMTEDDMRRFCTEHDIRCIIDAAHPFAENLHHTIAQAGLPVIRLERRYPVHRQGVTYIRSFEEVKNVVHCKRLLVLSGVNTIARLRDYWQENDTFFRIMNREDSLDIVRHEGFPSEKLIFYPDAMPSAEDEVDMMKQCGCDAILTKESGESGGFEAKVDAALRLGLKVFVVERPALPDEWICASGRHSLRRAVERLVPEFFPLHSGLTTGACCTAAVKAAMLSLYFDETPEEISFLLPDDEVISIPVEIKARGVASVVKENNDDHDVTKGCCITAQVQSNELGMLRYLHGEGVGRVTLPGLGIPVGEPAINPTPRQMIQREYESLGITTGADITVSVEGGRELARQTLNYKVGVVDGISIIGTSGIVMPLSNEAFVESIGRELQVAKAMGYTSVGIASGKNGEDIILAEEPSLRVIHYGNFVGETLLRADSMGFQRVVVGIMIGKAVKLAEGHMDTHSHKVRMNKDFLLAVSVDVCPDFVETLREALQRDTFMARELWDFMPSCFFDRITALCTRNCRQLFHGELEVRLQRQH